MRHIPEIRHRSAIGRWTAWLPMADEKGFRNKAEANEFVTRRCFRKIGKFANVEVRIRLEREARKEKTMHPAEVRPVASPAPSELEEQVRELRDKWRKKSEEISERMSPNHSDDPTREDVKLGYIAETLSDCADELDALLSSRPAEPSQISVPFQKELTVLMFPDDSPRQADADVKAAKNSIVFRNGVSENYFHQLRLNVAKNPELAKKIAVFYVQRDGVLREIDLELQDQLRWPVGFCQEAWDIECDVQKALFERDPEKYKHMKKAFQKATATSAERGLSGRLLREVFSGLVGFYHPDAWWDEKAERLNALAAHPEAKREELENDKSNNS